MTERIIALRAYLVEKKGQKQFRKPPENLYRMAEEFAAQKRSDTDRAFLRLTRLLNEETPVLLPYQTLVFARSISTVPALFTEEELDALKGRYRLHESGELSNISVNYESFLALGLPGMVQKIEQLQKRSASPYRTGLLQILEALTGLAGRYSAAAEKAGNHTAAESLQRLLKGAPATFRDALQLLRILHFTMWLSGSYHNTLGRFDQYMMPYLRTDLETGVLNRDSALELLEEFFLTCNTDSDLFPGMQQGDNGQSIVLGGMTPEGKDGYNLLSELCLRASLELKLIDPKINLRVSKDTPLSVYTLGTELTRQGLGFPQYANDDIVIPGLEDLGYRTEDARNYTTAACWEFIIPGKGMEIPNIDVLCFATLVRQVIAEKLLSCPDYKSLFAAVKESIYAETACLRENTKNLYIFPAPFASLMMENCVEEGKDVSLGCTYNNYGFHGAGLSTAADSLAAVKQYVFDTNKVSKEDLLHAMDTDFEGQDRLLHLLRYESPKMGNDEPLPDSIACALLDVFADSLEGHQNQRGGGFRAGTGSAMYYWWLSRDLGATPDGRRAGEGFAANYSPSLFIRSKGPVSMIKSFVKPNLRRTVNGGPLTMELHDSLFRGEDSLPKVAALVKSFTDLGGHQMQINAVNRDTLLEAQQNPEAHRNLIVRVWGWSGYFVELDKAYQDHIISRMELTL